MTDENTSPPPIVMPYDFSSEKQHLAMLLVSMPSPYDPGQRIPTPSKCIEQWCIDGWRLGYRHHPELQEIFPIPGDQPQMGWMNPARLVERAEYDAWLNTVQDQTTSLLLKVMGPQNRAVFEGMSDAEKADLLEKQRFHIKRSIAEMQQIAAEIDETLEPEAGDQ